MTSYIQFLSTVEECVQIQGNYLQECEKPIYKMINKPLSIHVPILTNEYDDLEA